MFDFKKTVLKINQSKNTLIKDIKKIESNNPVVIVYEKSTLPKIWKDIPNSEILKSRIKEDKDFYSTSFPNKLNTPVIFINFKRFENNRFKELTNIKNALKSHFDENVDTANIYINLINKQDEYDISEGIISFLGCKYNSMPSFVKDKKSKKANSSFTVNFYNLQNKHDFSRPLAESHGTSLARYLAMMPPNLLTPKTYVQEINKLATKYKFKKTFYGHKQLEKLNAGAFLAVVQGSSHKDYGIMHLRYSPKKANKNTKSVALVGKGMCFDTGGHNLKTPLGSMYGMHHDMTGSAIALASLVTLAELEVNFHVDCYLAIADNYLSADSYRPGDVVIASNGMSIEVINTDAEGRMVLSDTLYMASLKKPNLIMDYATLTGSCVRTLDNLQSGAVTNKPEFNSKLLEISNSCGERVWPLPYNEDYDEVLKSEVADIKQCHEGSSDATRAARFLGKFIEHDTPWVHIDLSANENNGGLAHVCSNTTGFGVRFTAHALLDSNL